MDFYKRKTLLATNIKLFLEKKQGGDETTWEDFSRTQSLELGVSDKTINKMLGLVEPRLTVVNNQLVKKE